MLALGRPTLVSDYAQFAELPDAVAVKVPVGEGEIESLVASAAELLADRGRLDSMGEAARAVVRSEHDPALAAAKMVAAVEELAERRPPDRRAVDVAAPSSIASSHLPGRLEVSGHEGPWPGGERRRLTVRLTNEGPARWLAGSAGPGGVVVEAKLLDAEGRLLEERPWTPLARDLAMGESEELTLEVRRPLGDVVLHVEPHVVGHRGFWAMGGPWWESAI